MRKRTKKVKYTKLDDWEWTTLVASWRYFEHRHTISSSMFPGDIIERFFGNGAKNWSDNARSRIAEQFVRVDHPRDDTWINTGLSIIDNDMKEWRKLWNFLKSYLEGFCIVTVSFNGRTKNIPAFMSDGKWIPVDNYKSNPHIDCFIAEEYITKTESK